jgi:hypothetical protein
MSILGEDLSLTDETTVLRILEYAARRLPLIDVYRHENGFVKIPIDLSATLQLRVHVWDTNSNWSGGALHSHRHPIQSRVVTGILREDRWLVDPTGTAYRRYDFSPSAPGATELVERGQVRLRHIQRSVRNAGDLYSMPVREFHVVRPKQVPAVTLFVQDLRELADASVASSQPLRVLSRPRLMDHYQRENIMAILISEIASLRAASCQHGCG